MNEVTNMANNLVFSVQKALNILDVLIFEDIDRKGLRLSQISKKTDIKTNTLHNLLKTMIDQNYIQQYENGNYAIGLKIDKVSFLNQINNDQYFLDVLENLRDDIKENIIFAVLIAGKWKLVKELPFENAIQVNNSKMSDSCIYEKATGRILISYCNNKELDELIDLQGMPNEKWNNISNIEEFNINREAIKDKGYYDMFTQEGQLWAIGIPVFNSTENVIGAIGCAAPSFRCDDIKKDYIRKRFIRISKEIKKRM